MPPHPAFWVLLGALALQRVAELATNRRNVRRLLGDGARLVMDDGYGLLVLTHSAFYVACIAEALFAPWAGLGWWTLPALAVFVVGETLRGWAIFALGKRYTTRIVVLPTAQLVSRGPYRFVRHPVYVGITLVLVAFPAAFGLWGTAAGIGLLNAVALARRIRREDLALRQATADITA